MGGRLTSLEEALVAVVRIVWWRLMTCVWSEILHDSYNHFEKMIVARHREAQAGLVWSR